MRCIVLFLAAALAACSPSRPAESPPPAERGVALLGSFSGEVDPDAGTVTIRSDRDPGSGKGALVEITGVALSNVGIPVMGSACPGGAPSLAASVKVMASPYDPTRLYTDVYAQIQEMTPTGSEGCVNAPLPEGLVDHDLGLWSYPSLGAENVGETTTWTFTFTAGIRSTFRGKVYGTPLPPGGLTYSANPAVYGVGVAIAANSPSSTGSAPASYSVSPALPAGLSLDTATGVITGTPTTATPSATYRVTATNGAGSTTADVVIRVSAVRVQLSTGAATIATNDHGFFESTVTGAVDTSVTWSISPSGTGSVSTQAQSVAIMYTPPLTPATVVLTATSNADPAVSASLTVTVAPTSVVYNNWNGDACTNGTPQNLPSFTVGTDTFIASIENWHAGGGALGQITLKHGDETVYGPWQAVGADAWSLANRTWVVYPNVTIKAGTYTVIESGPATWSYNFRSGFTGFSMLKTPSP